MGVTNRLMWTVTARPQEPSLRASASAAQTSDLILLPMLNSADGRWRVGSFWDYPRVGDSSPSIADELLVATF